MSEPLLTEGSRSHVSEAVTARHIAGPARGFVDKYFEGQDGILKTYEIDYDAVLAFDKDVAWSGLIGAVFFPPAIPFALCGMCCYQGYIVPNIRDKANATHLALTRDGIKYVVDRHHSACRLNCQEVGKVSKTVPYDKMTDCDVEEPAGAEGCCCALVPRTLKVVHVDTASSGIIQTDQGPKQTHELTLRGLVDAEGFKNDVWAMKRGEPVDGVDGTVAPMAVSMHRGGDAPAGGMMTAASMPGAATIAPLLEEQTALLKELLAAQKETNELLQRR